jgi:hypothetical protein
MAGLVPAIHVFDTGAKNVDARYVCVKTRFAFLPGRDEEKTC